MLKSFFRLLTFTAIIFCCMTVFGADFQVNQLGDAGDGTCDATCTLRDAVTAANGAASDDSISFSYVVFNSPTSIVVSGAEIIIANNGSLAINGNGADKIRIDGNGNGRIFSVSPGAVVNIKGLTFTGGNGVGATNTGRGGAIYNSGGNYTVRDSVFINNSGVNGGAMNTATNGTTNIINCEIVNNTALSSSGGGLQNFGGSTTYIIGSTFRGNRMLSTTATGGAIQANGNITITNSTFTGNMATNDGGAISFNGSSMVMTNTTITGNTANDQTGGLHKTTTANTAIIRNNVIAGNTGTSNNADTQGLFNSQGFNLIQNPGTTTGLTMDDITGTAALLTPLGNFGGSTYTHALLNGSPAIDAGDNCVIDLSCTTGNPPSAIPFDQRGAMRPVNTAVDIGSFEDSPVFVAKLDEGAIGVFYSEIIAPNRMGFTYTLVGSLPPGLMFNTPNFNKGEGVTPTAIISGTPTTNGIYNFQIVISNGTASTTVNYQIRIAPTNLTGRLLDDGGNPVSGVFVTLNDGMGGIQSTQTSIDGTYTFNNITAGTTYTVSFNSRRYAFRSEQIAIVAGTNRIDPIIPN